jgi:alpha-tubulin suppressor-like RCC1 family protein
MGLARVRVLGVAATAAAVVAFALAAPGARSAGRGATVQTWGEDGFGQLGTGPSASAGSSPVAGAGLAGPRAVAAGDSFDLALLSDGTVRAWGIDDSGELGDGPSGGPAVCATDVPCSPVPVAVSGLSGVVAIAAGSQHGLALLADGTVDAWGDNSLGELGDGTDAGPAPCASGTPCSTTPIPLAGLRGVAAVAAGDGYSLALLADGTVEGWGLEPGAAADATTPAPVSGLSAISAIAAGGLHALALRSDGTVLAWGDDNDGELGDGSDTTTATPVAVAGLSGVSAIAAGPSTSYAVLADGTVDAWGDNSSGELGDGSAAGPATCGIAASPCSSTPLAVPGLGGVVRVAAGGVGAVDPGQTGAVGFAFALRADGTVASWGANAGG